MSRIDETFKVLLKKESKALITYITAGDPDIETTLKLVPVLEDNGADIVELGVPFSDPLADGTTIQRASQRALGKGASLQAILQAAAEIRTRTSLPLALMSYYNPIMHYGIEAFVDDASKAGVDGVIIPDLPPEEAAECRNISDTMDLNLIFLVAPTSTLERIRMVEEYSSGFIYCVSVTGVTGARREMYEGLNGFIQRVRACTVKPLAVGFGIATPEQARQVAQWADGVIVGSALVNIIERAKDFEEMAREIGSFVKGMKRRINMT
ncbi:MAG: tryptophan synthase subunit alpha [Gemmatimonadota bacterium]|nr:MAG: tryptophan synthase subunit alpha [Gemmatimonadota bacterium]